MNEDKMPRLARMVTINRTFFWIFLVICLGLYIINKILSANISNTGLFSLNNSLIIGAAFTALLLNLLTAGTGNAKNSRMLTKACYIFEIASLIVLAFMVLIFN